LAVIASRADEPVYATAITRLTEPGPQDVSVATASFFTRN